MCPSLGGLLEPPQQALGAMLQMRKLTHGVEWLTQGHANQRAVQEHAPFKFQHLCSLYYSALNPSVGNWKTALSFPQMNVLVVLGAVLSVMVFVPVFLLSLPILVILPIKLSYFPSGTDIFHLLPLRSSQAKESFIFLADPWPSISKSASALADVRCQNPESPTPYGELQKGRVPPWSLKWVFLASAQICFQLGMCT